MSQESKRVPAGRARRDEVKERFWREAIAQQRRGGESVRAFCRKRRLRETSFYYWRRELRLRDHEANGVASATPRLAPVVVIDEPRGEGRIGASASIEIVLSGGTTLRVGPGATPEQLDMVFAAVERTRC